MDTLNQPVLHALVGTDRSVERPIPNLARTFIFTFFSAIAGLFVWLLMWAFWPAQTYLVSGFTNLPTVLCPNEQITITLFDRLREVPMVETLGVTAYNQPVSITGEPVFSELAYPIPANDIREGKTTSFTRVSPLVEGTYFFRLHVDTTVKVAGFWAPRTVRQNVLARSEKFEVKDGPLCGLGDE